jgi:hypothetical protein
MNDFTWPEQFRQSWEAAVQAYRTGHRSLSDFPAVPGIGCTAQEMYDFAEDAEELPFEAALLITAVRRDYFLVVQNGKLSGHVVPLDEFPAKDAEVAGFRWLPRLIVKARAKLRGELPAELMYSCGGDRAFLRKVNIHPADFLRHVWAAREDEGKIVEYVRRAATRPTC